MPNPLVRSYRLLVLCLFSFFAVPLAIGQTSPSTPPYLDPSLPFDQSVNDLVSRMTLEEKASQMQDVAPAIPRLIPASTALRLAP
jgi:hypothetical protein